MNDLLKRAREESQTDFDVIFLSIISAVLATIGIILKDNFIIIASMLIAPFLEPIISFVVFLYTRNIRGMIESTLTFLLITLISFITSAILSLILSFWRNSVDITYYPRIDGEYLFVACALGSVAMLLWLWPKRFSQAAGLSVAISLMPPLANLGRSLLLLDLNLILSSAFAFFINVVGILIGAFITLTIIYKANLKKLRH